MKPKFNQQYLDNLKLSLALSGQSATFFAEYQAQKLAAWFPNLAHAPIAILDFGCGEGLMTSFVQHIFTNTTITGIDADAERIALARDTYEGINFICADITTKPLSFPDNSFDLIYATQVLHHLPRTHHAQYIAALMRVLKPGGTLIIFELNPLNLATVYRFKTNSAEHTAHLIMPWTLWRLLKSYGSISLRFYDFFPNFMRNLRTLEPYLSLIPFGALYAICVKKRIR